MRDVPRPNRVTPYGTLVAVAARGLFWGNRGCLHDDRGDIVRYSRGQAWLICLLEFKGRRRQLLAPGRLSELFFLDEATALAAGHRPCGECRAAEYRRFREAWTAPHPGPAWRAPAIDLVLHRQRLLRPGVRRTYQAPLRTLPDGAMVELEGAPWLVWGTRLLAWEPEGYRSSRARPGAARGRVLTPRGTIGALAHGYRPVVHPSAQALP